MDPLTAKIFTSSLQSMMAADPWHEMYPLDEKLKKAWKVASEATDFIGKKIRAERNKPRK